MTRANRSFPVGLRILVAGLAMLALTLNVPALAAGAPSGGQVTDAKKAYDAALAKLSSIRSQVAAIQSQLNAAVQRVDAQQQLVDQVTAQVLATQQRIEAARAKYAQIRSRLNGGPSRRSWTARARTSGSSSARRRWPISRTGSSS